MPCIYFSRFPACWLLPVLAEGPISSRSAQARFFRIYPGLIAAALIVFFALAIIVSNEPLANIVRDSITSYFAKILIALAGSSSIRAS